MTWREDGRETLKIVALSIGACIAYGIAHDSVTARLCVQYFTVGHPRVIASESPQLLALVWGVLATWWVGAILGVLLSVAARAGAPPKTDARALVAPVLAMMACVGVISIAAGAVGYGQASRGAMPMWVAVSDLTDSQKLWFTIDLWAHGAAYLAGFAGGVVLAVSTWALRRPPGQRVTESMRIGGFSIAGAISYGIAQATVVVLTFRLPPALILTGVLGTWWIGLFYGLVLAAAARLGSRTPATWRDLRMAFAVAMATCAVAATLGGVIFHGRRDELEVITNPRFAGALGAQAAATIIAFAALPFVAIRVWMRRTRAQAGHAP